MTTRTWTDTDLKRMLTEAKRELALRVKWYPIWIRERRLKPEKMDAKRRNMEDIVAFLEQELGQRETAQQDLFGGAA